MKANRAKEDALVKGQSTAMGIGLSIVIALFVGHGAAVGQGLKPVGEIGPPGPLTSEAPKKIVQRLRGLIADFRALGITRESAGAMDPSARFSSSTLKVDGAGRVQVYVSVSDTTESTLAVLRRHGLDTEIVNADLGIVQGWVPVDALEGLAQEPVVTKIRPPSYARTKQQGSKPRTGSVNSQGDAIHRCDQARAMGFTGAGVKVGAISDGVDGLAASQASGDLGSVQVLTPGSGDEGTALLEIVADCAPGATLAFSAGNTTIEFINSVNALRSAGAQIIVDDLGFPGEPYFEDGAVARNDRVAGRAALRVSAAGNDALGHYQAPFNPGLVDPGRGTRHDFGGGDTRMRFRVPGGLKALIVLQWGNPFGAAGDDYDLFVFQPGSNTLITSSEDFQNGSQDPIEFVEFTCTLAPGMSCFGDIQITRFAGAAQLLELFCFDPCSLQEFNSPADSIIGQPAVPEVLAVAASPASDPTSLETFSSRGFATSLFPPIVRNKPDITGIDGVSTSRSGFNPFFGTSAAAPHVAGVAALLAQANPSYLLVAPQFFANALRATAVDLGTPGPDTGFGAGRADALNAVSNELSKARCEVSSNRSSVPQGQPLTITVKTFPGAGDPWDIYFLVQVSSPAPSTLFSLNLAPFAVGPANVIQPARPTAPITTSSQSFTATAPIVAQLTFFCLLVDPGFTRINRFSSVPVSLTP
jgi:subtilisin family serine protease